MSDNLCKLLTEKYPDQLASWVLGTPQSRVEVLKTELTIEPIRADAVIFLQLPERILHLEFQTRLASNPPLPLRMIDYWVRLYRLYRVPVTQVVVLLLPPTPGTIIETVFVVETTRHEYRVLCLWEENPDELLNNPVLLPFAPLAASSQGETLLQQVALRVSQLEEPQRQEVSAYTELLAGLKFEKELIRRLFREDIMEESVIYQDILEKGRQLERQERLGGERSLIQRQLTRRVGEIPEAMLQRLDTLRVEQLENLGEALLDFEAKADLEAWFEALE